MQHVLITGANRGIGLALSRAYAERGDALVFATARQPEAAHELNALAAQYPDQVRVIALDVGQAASIDAAAQAVSAQTDALDILINNAAVNPPRADQSLDSITPETLLDVMNVNVMGPLLVARAFAGLLRRGSNPRMANISSGLGSLHKRTYGGLYAYSTSKAALNSVTRGLAVDLPEITVIALGPGWVRTDMGGESASLAPEESAAGIVSVLDGLTHEASGGFYQWDGQTVPW